MRAVTIGLLAVLALAACDRKSYVPPTREPPPLRFPVPQAEGLAGDVFVPWIEVHPGWTRVSLAGGQLRFEATGAPVARPQPRTVAEQPEVPRGVLKRRLRTAIGGLVAQALAKSRRRDLVVVAAEPTIPTAEVLRVLASVQAPRFAALVSPQAPKHRYTAGQLRLLNIAVVPQGAPSVELHGSGTLVVTTRGQARIVPDRAALGRAFANEPKRPRLKVPPATSWQETMSLVSALLYDEPGGGWRGLTVELLMAH